MHCTEWRVSGSSRVLSLASTIVATAFLVACGSSTDRTPPAPAGNAAKPVVPVPTAPVATPAIAAPSTLPLPEPKTMSSWADVRRQAAERIVAANPGKTYTGKVPDQLLAIPVLEIELNADGSIRRIEVLREPRQARDTMKIAIEAIRRAAPYGNVSRLPKPWKFVETFLFDESRRFKPRTLDT